MGREGEGWMGESICFYRSTPSCTLYSVNLSVHLSDSSLFVCLSVPS